MSEEKTKSLIDFDVQYGYWNRGYGWRVTVKNHYFYGPKDVVRQAPVLYCKSLSEVQDTLEGNLERILNEMWVKLQKEGFIS